MTDRKKKIIVTSPLGVAVYPKLNKPDTEYKPLGEYSCKLRLNSSLDEHKAFLNNLKELTQAKFDETMEELKEKKKFKEAKELKMCLPYSEILDDEGNETDLVHVTFKMAAVVKPKEGDTFTQKPKIFDAKGVEIANPPTIWSQSLLKINAEVISFYTAIAGAGISLRLRAVKLIKLVTSNGGDATSFGFGDDESANDGYVFVASEAQAPTASPSESSDDGDF